MTGCASHPSVCGYPDASNTGITPGVTLTPVAGNVILSTDNEVYEGKDVHGCIEVDAAGVTIRNVRVTCTSGYGIYHHLATGAPLLIQNVEVDCAGSPTAAAIGDANLIASRVYLHHGCENGFDADQDVTVQDSYVTDLNTAGGNHADGIQLTTASVRDVVRHNTMIVVGGTSAMISDPTHDSDITVAGNLFGGGAYTLYCPSTTTSNFLVDSNRFVPVGDALGPAYGMTDSCTAAGVTFTGNLNDDTGALIGAA